MKNEFWRKTAFTALVLPVLAVSCTKTIDDGAAGTPAVEIETGAVTSTSISFTFTASDADEIIYLVRVAGTPLTVDELTASGESLLYLEPITRNYTNLQPDTEYTVYAVALREGEHGEMVSADMTTAAMAPVEPDVVHTARSARITYWGSSSVSGVDEFTLTISDAANGINSEGGLTFAPNSVNARLILWTSPAADPAAPRLPDGTYYYNATHTPSAGSIDESASAVVIYDANGERSMASGYIGADSRVEVTSDGDVYNIVAIVAVRSMTGEDTVYEFDWTGNITSYIGEEDDRSVILDKDVTDMEFVEVSAIYQGRQGGYDMIALEFTDLENASGQSGYPNTSFLSLIVYTDLNNGSVLPAATYNVAQSSGLNVVQRGNFDGTAESLAHSYFLATGRDGYISDADGIDSGTMTVAPSSGDGLEFKFDFMTTNGHSITGSFTGPVTVQGTEPVWQTNLTGDYQFSWGDNVYYASADNAGDEAGTGNTKWQVVLVLESGDGVMDYFYADLYSEGTSDRTLPAGTYNASSSVGAPWSFTPGTYEGYGSYTYWYKTASDGYTEVLWAPFVGGKIEVSGGMDGADYTFVFDLLDDAGHHVTGTWTGQLN